MEKALYQFTLNKKIADWPGPFYFRDQVDNLPPRFEELIQKTDLGNYLNTAPHPPLGSHYEYRYTTFDSGRDIVYIKLLGTSAETLNGVDQIVDQAAGTDPNDLNSPKIESCSESADCYGDIHYILRDIE